MQCIAVSFQGLDGHWHRCKGWMAPVMLEQTTGGYWRGNRYNIRLQCDLNHEHYLSGVMAHGRGTTTTGTTGEGGSGDSGPAPAA